MTPQATPLYAVGTWDDNVDLLLVVGWTPLDDGNAFPVFVHLESTRSLAVERRASTLETWHDQLAYFDHRDSARRAYLDAVEAASKPEEPNGMGYTRADYEAAATAAGGAA